MTNTELVAHQMELYRQTHKVVDLEEFREDYGRILSIIKALTTYQRSGELKTRLIMNHIIVVTNSFGPYAVSLLFLKSTKGQEHDLFTFLDCLGFIPDNGHIVLPDSEFITTKNWKRNPEIQKSIEEELCRG